MYYDRTVIIVQSRSRILFHCEHREIGSIAHTCYIMNSVVFTAS
jgi:hypothetical protein